MPKLKLPKDFCYWSRPHPPIKPLKFLTKSETIETLTVSPYDSVCYEDIPKCSALYFDIKMDDYENHVPDKIIIKCIQNKNDIPNPNYEKETEQYEEKRKKYLADLKEWNKNKKIYEDEKKAKELEVKKQLFEKLKKELGE